MVDVHDASDIAYLLCCAAAVAGCGDYLGLQRRQTRLLIKVVLVLQQIIISFDAAIFLPVRS